MKSISQQSVTFKVHNKSVQIEITRGRIVPARSGAKQRGTIKDFSYRSERRFRIVLEDNIDVAGYFTVFTYPGEFSLDGRKLKRDIDVMSKRLQRAGHEKGIWGIEFQKRGAPHINLLTKNPIDQNWLSFAWYEVVGSGDPNHILAGTGTEKVRSLDEAITYMIGYVGKREQKDVPEGYQNVGRFWGYWGDIKTKSKGQYTYRFKSDDDLEAFLKPVVEHYQAKMEEWARERKKPYKWQYRGNSFTMWSGADFIEKFIEGEFKHGQIENQKEKCGIRPDDGRRLCVPHHRLAFRIQSTERSVFRESGLGERQL